MNGKYRYAAQKNLNGAFGDAYQYAFRAAKNPEFTASAHSLYATSITVNTLVSFRVLHWMDLGLYGIRIV